MQRRTFVRALIAAPAFTPWSARAATSLAIRLDLPGPGTLPFLPLELIPSLGLDRAMGARLILRYRPSGVLAFEDMQAGNADFAAHAGAILPGMAHKGLKGRAIALLADRPLPFAMLVRADLSQTIHNISDLGGRVIATTSGSHTSPSLFQMLGEALLARHGIMRGQVRWLQTGQTEKGMAATLLAKRTDAVWCEQPFSDRLQKRGLAKPLPLSEDDEHYIDHAWHLRAVISMVDHRDSTTSPEQTRKAVHMARMVKAVLAWLHTHTSQEIAAHYPTPEARTEVAAILEQIPQLFSPDGRFPQSSILAMGETLVQWGRLDEPGRLQKFIDPRWIEALS